MKKTIDDGGPPATVDRSEEAEFTSVNRTSRRKRKRPSVTDEVSSSSGEQQEMDTGDGGSHKRRPIRRVSKDGSAAAAFFPPLVKRPRHADEDEAAAMEMRRVPIPSHRYSPLKENWLKIFEPIVEHLLLQVRFNLRTRNVEIRNTKDTKEDNALQKAADFVRAFALGFDVADALALLRLDDLFIDTFEVQDVKPLKGDHLSRAVGRIAGKGGKTRFMIENVTKTRIVLADRKIHILGSYQNIAIARRAVCNLILGSPPSKVYGTLRAVANRAGERF